MGAESLGAVLRARMIRLSLFLGAKTAPKLSAPSPFLEFTVLIRWAE
jgi:hypothetical protein